MTIFPALGNAWAGLQFRPPVSTQFVLRRLAFAALTVWLVASLVFIAIIATGDPVVLMVDPDTLPEERARISALLGYDQPWFIQYWKFITGAISGTFPQSIRYQTSAFDVALARLPASLLLGGTGLGLGAALGLLLGYVSVVSRVPGLRKIPILLAGIADAIPTFFIGILLVLLFGIYLRWLPISGTGTPQHLVLPVAILAITVAAHVARIFRASLLETLAMDHVVSARARGVHPALIGFRHVFINALGPVVNLTGIQAGMVFGGAIVVETLFRWPGIGQLSIAAIQNRDYPLVVASLLVLATGFAITTFVVDIANALLDPRLRS